MPRPADPTFACIDLFCGCGGNSWGMLQPSGRPLTPLLALDIDLAALASYRANMPRVPTVAGDICQISPQYLLSRAGLQPDQLGCLVASPPCQTYSRNNRLPKNENDPRNTLYARTLVMIAAIRPWTVLIENVPEMETYRGGTYHTDFLTRLTNLGYRVGHWTVDAAAYGVPQRRRRLIYLAYRSEMGCEPRCPPPTHGESEGLLPWVTVGDALGDLPTRAAGERQDWFATSVVDDARLPAYVQARRAALSLAPASYGISVLSAAQRRAVEGRVSERIRLVRNHAARPLNTTQMRRLQALGEGQAYNDLPTDLRPVNGYEASYGRLWRHRPAPTLTTWLAYPSCGRFSHYDQDRVLTIREALRLQGFDDCYQARGTLIQQSAQVGNAVPPPLSTAFKDVIVAALTATVGGKQRAALPPDA